MTEDTNARIVEYPYRLYLVKNILGLGAVVAFMAICTAVTVEKGAPLLIWVSLVVLWFGVAALGAGWLVGKIRPGRVVLMPGALIVPKPWGGKEQEITVERVTMVELETVYGVRSLRIHHRDGMAMLSGMMLTDRALDDVIEHLQAPEVAFSRNQDAWGRSLQETSGRSLQETSGRSLQAAIAVGSVSLFVGAPLYLIDGLEVMFGRALGFAIAIAPLLFMAVGAETLVEDEFVGLSRLVVWLGGVGAVTLTGASIFTIWRILHDGLGLEDGLFVIGCVASFLALAAYFSLWWRETR